MNKFAKRTLIVVISFLMSLTAIGCTLRLNGQQHLVDSVDSAKAVIFNSGSPAREKMDRLDAIEKVKRSVVAIKMPMPDNTASYGSGVIINVQRFTKNGQIVDGDNIFYILTCYHVVESKGDIIIYVPDAEGDNWGEHDYDYNYCFTGNIGDSFNDAVTLIGGDLNSDIALLRLNISGSNVSKDNIVKADLAPTTGYEMKVGEEVFAIGNPSGMLPGSVTVGTIGYINREIVVSDIGEMTLIQLNVDIYHGSSGGALFNLYGEVIGVTNSGSDKYIGIGYAVPFIIDPDNGSQDNGFLNIVSQLLGTYNGQNYGYISGRIENFGFTAEQSESSSNTVKISSILTNSQADSVDMEIGDIVESVQISRASVDDNGEIIYTKQSLITIRQLQDLTQAIESLNILDKITINLKRLAIITYNKHSVTLTTRQFIFCDTGVYPSA